MTDCPNATVRDRLPDLLHGALDAPARAAVEAHLAACADCASELALLRAARAAMARTPAIDVARIIAALPSPVSAGPRLVQFPTPGERAHRHPVAGRRRAALAAAAALVLAVGVGSVALRDRAPAPSQSTASAASTPSAVPALDVDPAGASAGARAPASGGAALAPLLAVNTSALSDADLAGLLDDLDDLEAVPAADPVSVVPVDELPTGSGDGL